MQLNFKACKTENISDLMISLRKHALICLVPIFVSDERKTKLKKKKRMGQDTRVKIPIQVEI